MSRAAALLRKGAKHKKTEEDNPIWQKKDWKGDTMVQFKSDGLWGYKSMQGLANDNPMASAVSSFKNLLGKKIKKEIQHWSKLGVKTFSF